MAVCDCGFVSKSGAGLAAHRRSCDAKPEAVDLEVTSVASALGSMRATLEAQAKVLAVAIDTSDSVRDLSSLSRELRIVMQALDELSEGGGAVDDLAKLRESRAARKAASSG